jgi:hypothetical protein
MHVHIDDGRGIRTFRMSPACPQDGYTDGKEGFGFYGLLPFLKTLTSSIRPDQ